MKAGLYARVSTDEQTTEQQLVELRHMAESRGYKWAEYVDDGFSGALPEGKRPGLQKMMEDAHRGRIKVVMCWDVSRLGRSVQIVVNLVERLREYGVQFATLRDIIDTTTPQGEFQFHVFAALAQLNRKMISQNTKAKLAILKRRGVKLGPPTIANRKKRKAVDPQMITVRIGKMSYREIARELGIGKTTVQRYAKAMPLSHKGDRKRSPIIVGRN